MTTPSDPLDDHGFLTELIRHIDRDPTGRHTGRSIAAALGHPDADVDATVQRLKARGLIAWSPAPSRVGDGWDDRSLTVTPDGYRHDDTGLTR